MTLTAFLKDRRSAILIGLVCTAGIAGMLLVLDVGVHAVLLAVGFMTVCGAAALAVGFVRRRRFYTELADLCQQIDRAYLLAALLDEPRFLEGRIAFEALEAIGRSAADNVALHDQMASEYREYIELWIHEVKTPIAAAKLLCAEMHGREAERLRSELDRIEAQVEQALYYARSTSLEQDFSVREISLASVVKQVCRKNARMLIDAGVVPDIQVPEGTSVFADAKWLCFVLTQLVVNSSKYEASTVRFSVAEEGEGTRARTVLTVADDGCGIPASDVPRVFDRGFTGENGRTFGSSTGMGLYLSAVMCEKMGLALSVASEEGTGTRVMIAFPHDRRSLNLSKA